MAQHRIEVFSADCPFCEEAVRTVQNLVEDDDTVTVLDVHEQDAAERARSLGVRSVPAVAVNGQLAACCTDQGIDEQVLRQAGLGAA